MRSEEDDNEEKTLASVRGAHIQARCYHRRHLAIGWLTWDLARPATSRLPIPPVMFPASASNRALVLEHRPSKCVCIAVRKLTVRWTIQVVVRVVQVRVVQVETMGRFKQSPRPRTPFSSASSYIGSLKLTTRLRARGGQRARRQQRRTRRRPRRRPRSGLQGGVGGCLRVSLSEVVGEA